MRDCPSCGCEGPYGTCHCDYDIYGPDCNQAEERQIVTYEIYYIEEHDRKVMKREPATVLHHERFVTDDKQELEKRIAQKVERLLRHSQADRIKVFTSKPDFEFTLSFSVEKVIS